MWEHNRFEGGDPGEGWVLETFALGHDAGDLRAMCLWMKWGGWHSSQV
jgi:hypothetical protein